ncbi:MAG: ABC transporter permease [Acidimicrobiales bacterium]|nr:ABC transporter permease [Acidimicrobiales bacterium]
MIATGAASTSSAVKAQALMELKLTLRRGESVLLTFLIPIVLLAFFSQVDVFTDANEDRITSLFPGILALAIMSTSFVSIAIATGFERQMGVLKRLGATPLTRRALMVAKTCAVVVVQLIQMVVLGVEALLLGFRFDGADIALALVGAVLATIAFAGLGLLMAGSLPALTTLAAANGLYLLLLLISGMVIPLDQLPEFLQSLAAILPSGALTELFNGSIGTTTLDFQPFLVLALWAGATPLLAAKWFRWE